MEKVTIIIPCYNYGLYLSEAIESILAQTYNSWECLIIDDGSTDNTKEVSLNYCKKDTRIKYIYKTNGGLSSARNEGIKNATGSFIQFLDADDFIDQHKLKEQIEIFDLNPELTVCYSNFEYIDSLTKKIIPKGNERRLELNHPIYNDFVLNWVNDGLIIPIHCPIFKKQFLSQHRIRFNENLKAIEDWLFWIELSKNNAKFHFIDKPFAYYRKHNQSMVHNESHMLRNYIKAALIVSNNLDNNLLLPFCEKYSQQFANEITASKSEIKNIKNSVTYKVGNFILLPYKFIKRFTIK